MVVPTVGSEGLSSLLSFYSSVAVTIGISATVSGGSMFAIH